MGYEAKKTEHCGPKHGNGAYRIRSENWKREIRAALTDRQTGRKQPG